MGKSVDWLDVLAVSGPQAVARGMTTAALLITGKPVEPGEPGAPEAIAYVDGPECEPYPEGEAGDNQRNIGHELDELIRYAPVPRSALDARLKGHLVRPTENHRDWLARLVLVNKFMPSAEHAERARSTWMIARHGGVWWVRPKQASSMQRWLEIDDEAIDAAIGRYLCSLWREKSKGELVPFAPNERAIKNVMAAVTDYTFVGVKQMPCWLPEAFDDDGKPTWTTRVDFEDVAEDGGGPIPVQHCIAARNGLFNVQAWRDGRVELSPPNPRFFNASCLPYEIPVAKLRAALDEEQKEREVSEDAEDEAGRWTAGAVEDLFEELCPNWLNFIRVSARNASPENPQAWEMRAQEIVGYVASWYRRFHSIFLIQGISGSGKDVFATGMTCAVGEDNVAMWSPDKLSGRFDLPSLVGKMMYRSSEARIDTRKTDVSAFLNALYSISGGVAQRVEDKNISTKKTANVKLQGAFVITTDQALRLNDPAAAGARRFVPLPFQPFHGEPDRDLETKIRDEAQGIFCWGLFGLRRLMKNRKFTPVKAAQEVLDELIQMSAPLKGFIAEHMIVQAGASVSTKMIRELFRAWAKEEGYSWLEDVAPEEFGRLLLAGVAHVRHHNTGKRDAEGRQIHVYAGLRPLSVAEQRRRADCEAKKLVFEPDAASDVLSWDHRFPRPGVATYDNDNRLPL